jgi:acetolactate synthase-1/2/3 large subunit
MTQETDTYRVADWVVSRIADEGVGHIFLLPGGGAMHLNDAITLEPRIQGVVCQHEQACGIAAEAYGRTGNPANPGFGVAMVTSGPGATNVITPVVGAWIDSVPMLVISGQARRADLVGSRGIRQGGVQEVDIVRIVSSVTKYAVTVMDPLLIEEYFETALRLMRSSRPGPVWLDIPLDVQAAPFRSPILRVSSRASIAADDSDRSGAVSGDLAVGTAQEIVTMLSNVERPLILAGHGVRLSGAAKAFRELIEMMQIPCVTTWNALDLLPFDHPMNVGRPGVVATRAANFAVQNCDFLLSIGARLDNTVTGYNLTGFARSAKKVVVDIDNLELANKSALPNATFVHSDAKVFVDAVSTIASPLKIEAWRNICMSWKSRYTLNEGLIFPHEGEISHAHFVDVLSDVAPPDSLVATGSSGLAVEFFYAGFKNKEGQRTFLTSGLGSMGYGLPAAIGACLGNCSRPMIALESDGSLQLNIQELATVSSLSLPICLIVMNNGGYASIRNTQRNYFNSRYIGSGFSSGLHLPSLEGLAGIYGLKYFEVTDASELRGVLLTATESELPALVNVTLITDEALQPKCSAIPQPDGSMLSMPLEDMTPLLPIEVLASEMYAPISEASKSARNFSKAV